MKFLLSAVPAGFLILSLAATAQPWQATYEIPDWQGRMVSDEYLDFLLYEASWTVEQDVLYIEYKLPRELVDKRNTTIKMSGKILRKKSIRVRGELGQGICRLRKTSLRCEVSYPPMRIDSSLVEIYINKRYQSFEAKDRLEVAAKFSEIPEGVLYFEFAR